MTKRTTRSVSKRQHAATFVGRPAAKRPKRVIIVDSEEVTDHSDSDSKRSEKADEEGEEEQEAESAEEEVEPVEDREVNAKEVMQYNIRARSPFWENGFSAAFRHPPFIKRVIEHYGWHNLCQQPEGTSEGMVGAFYRNLDEEAFTSEVRGVAIDASAAAINRIYGLPNDHEAATLRRLFDPTSVELQTALRAVAIPGANWRISPRGHKTLRHRDIKPRLQTWLYFIKKRLLQTTHDTTVSPDRVLLLYRIRRCLPINVGAVIAHTMADYLSRIRGRLLYPSLICRLCIAAGVAPVELGRKCRVLKPIDLELILELEGTRAARVRAGDIDIPDRHTLADADFSSPEREANVEDDNEDNAGFADHEDEDMPPFHSHEPNASDAHRHDTPPAPTAEAAAGSGPPPQHSPELNTHIADLTAVVGYLADELEASRHETNALIAQIQTYWRYVRDRDAVIASTLPATAAACLPVFPNDILTTAKPTPSSPKTNHAYEST